MKNFPKEIWLMYQLLAGNIDTVIDELEQHSKDVKFEGCFADGVMGFALFLWYSSGRHNSIADIFKRFWASQGARLTN